MRHANPFLGIPSILTIVVAMSFGTEGLADRIPSTLEQRIGLAETIAEFVVEGVSSRRLKWDGPEATGGIFTFVELRKLEVFVGETDPSVTIRVPGGEIPGDAAMFLGDYPRFEIGERVILLLSNEVAPPDGTAYALVFCPVIAGELGKYTVTEDVDTGVEHVIQIVGGSDPRPMTGDRGFGRPYSMSKRVPGQAVQEAVEVTPRETRMTKAALLAAIRAIRPQPHGG